MDENPRSINVRGSSIPVTMYWHRKPTLCLSKEEAAKRRPPKGGSSMPVSIQWLKDPTRHLLKTKAVKAQAKGNDAGNQAKPAPKPDHKDKDSSRAE